MIGVRQTIVHLGDNRVPNADLPSVEPHGVTRCPDRFGQALGQRFISTTVTDEDSGHMETAPLMVAGWTPHHIH